MVVSLVANIIPVAGKMTVNKCKGIPWAEKIYCAMGYRRLEAVYSWLAGTITLESIQMHAGFLNNKIA